MYNSSRGFSLKQASGKQAPAYSQTEAHDVCRSAEENRRRTPNQVEKNQGREEVDREIQLRILPPLFVPAR
jgi:hypothetical protein